MHRDPLNWWMQPIQSENKALLYIYDDVEEFGDFNWNTWEYEDSETSAKHFRDVLSEIPDDAAIELHINSNGGSVKEGTAIYNLLRQKPNHKTVIVDGVAHSIAFLIVQAGDERIMMPGTTALLHNMWLMAVGNAAELRKCADDLDVMMEANRKVFAERATISEEELKALMDAETYLTPDKALEYGLIDRVGLEVETSESADGQQERSTEYLMKELSALRQQISERKTFREEYEALMTSVAPVQQDAPEETPDEPDKPEEPPAEPEEKNDGSNGNPMMDFFNKLEKGV